MTNSALPLLIAIRFARPIAHGIFKGSRPNPALMLPPPRSITQIGFDLTDDDVTDDDTDDDKADETADVGGLAAIIEGD